MQVGVDVKCMHTNFGGRSLFDFGDFAHFCLHLNLAKFPFQTIEGRLVIVTEYIYM